MENSKKISFKVMITFPSLLKSEIEDYNKSSGTNFRVKEVIDNEVPFCIIEADNYKLSDIFDLGYSLAATQYTLRQKGELDW